MYTYKFSNCTHKISINENKNKKIKIYPIDIKKKIKIEISNNECNMLVLMISSQNKYSVDGNNNSKNVIKKKMKKYDKTTIKIPKLSNFDKKSIMSIRFFIYNDNTNENANVNVDSNVTKYEWEKYFAELRKKKFQKNINFKFSNNFISVNNNNCQKINENKISITRHVKIKHIYKNILNDVLNLLNKFVLIIDFPNLGGGTTFFLSSIISKYKYYNTFVIARNIGSKLVLFINDDYELEKKYTTEESIVFLDEYKNNIEKIFINHLIGHNDEFVKKITKLDKEITFITHDYYLFSSIPNPLIEQIGDKDIILNKCSKLITQNYSNLYFYKKFIKNNPQMQIIVSELPDYKERERLIKTMNNKIIIGIIGLITDIKGKKILDDIKNFFSANDKFEIVVFGRTNDSVSKNSVYSNIVELNKLLIKYKPNLLLELSVWPETYSYTLTLGMITDLPILYVRKTGYFTVESRLSKYSKSFPFDTLEELENLVIQNKQSYFYTISPFVHYNKFWNNYFNKDNGKLSIDNKKFSHNITLYPIYFPQFHKIKENNISFYNGFTDMKNLSMLKVENKETPNLRILELKTMTDYDLTNLNIVQKQIDILTDYGLGGFAIYYYWFSTNTITNDNMVMEKVINQFFNPKLNIRDKKVFFIWANENWSSNPSFGNSTHTISNSYDLINIKKNVENLLKYFSNSNYLKVNNCPVLMLYHPWLIEYNDLILFKEILTTECIKNDFGGIKIYVNSMNGKVEDFDNFIIHFNYKKETNRFYCQKNKQAYLDYDKYISGQQENLGHNKINTLVFDFDNRARLYKPDKIKLSTICVNNTEFNKIRYIDKIKKTYKKLNDKNTLTDNLDEPNILLVNAWNEWGEKMNIEPSNEYNFYYLNLLYDYLKQ